MAGKFEAPRSGGNRNQRRPRRRRRRFQPLFLVPVIILLIVVALILTMCGRKDADDPGGKTQSNRPGQTTEGTAEATEPLPAVVATATVASQGDLLMHSYLFSSNPKYPAAAYIEDGVYNFDSIFQYVQPYVSGADYAVINLETTFGGSSIGYSGNPLFNCPDALADSVSRAGYDMLLTANNHCHDTGASGIKRTLEQIRGRNLATLGTQLDDGEKKYAVVDVNGIRIGMLCYTYAGGLESDGSPNLNLRAETVVKEPGIVNTFTNDHLDEFYSQVQAHLANMEAEGAEAVIMYIHWGVEYDLTENATQRAMAQKLCDLGVDVIIGGHPHVVEPMDLLTSTTDPEHKTVCIYSLGNAVSNQRKEEMQKSCPTGHTEDGALFTVTFEKYSDGTVHVSDADVLPTWVNKFTNGDGKVEYNILPLDQETKDQWKTLYNLSDTQYAETQSSYSRTMDIVNTGLTKCRDYLEQVNTQRGQTALPEDEALAA